MEGKEETEKEYDVRFPVTIRFSIFTTTTLTGTHIILSSSQKEYIRGLNGFVHSISDCAKVTEYLELHRHSPVFLVFGHITLNFEAKFCQKKYVQIKFYGLLNMLNISI
jgi:hypothetical protein